jgi:hypothetical protein
MWLLLVYLVLCTAGTLVTYLFVGQVVERLVPWASLPAFLCMFFAMLWVSWLIAVKVTAPRDEQRAPT